MHSLVALFVFLACLHVCTVHGDIVLSPAARYTFMVECNNITKDVPHCERGLKALKTLDSDPDLYLNTMGFYVPGYQGDFSPVFWSSYQLGYTNMAPTLSALTHIDPSLWSSFNILPGAVANALYKHPDFPQDVFTLPQFWIPYSEWMAINSQGLALYLSGSATGFFPPDTTTIFESYELPNLDSSKVNGLVALHLPPPNTSPIKCQDDTESFQHLEEVNPSIAYYCCDLSTFQSPNKSAWEISTVSREVAEAIEQGVCVRMRVCMIVCVCALCLVEPIMHIACLFTMTLFCQALIIINLFVYYRITTACQLHFFLSSGEPLVGDKYLHIPTYAWS